ADDVVEPVRDTDIHPVMENDALRLHLRDAAVNMVLLHLEVGDAVAQQAACLRLALEDMHLVPDPGELLSRGHPGRPGADDGNPLSGAGTRRLGPDPAVLPGLVGDRLLNRLDGDGHALEIERACLLAR